MCAIVKTDSLGKALFILHSEYDLDITMARSKVQNLKNPRCRELNACTDL
jgi:hypothetical protein